MSTKYDIGQDVRVKGFGKTRFRIKSVSITKKNILYKGIARYGENSIWFGDTLTFYEDEIIEEGDNGEYYATGEEHPYHNKTIIATGLNRRGREIIGEREESESAEVLFYPLNKFEIESYYGR